MTIAHIFSLVLHAATPVSECLPVVVPGSIPAKPVAKKLKAEPPVTDQQAGWMDSTMGELS